MPMSDRADVAVSATCAATFTNSGSPMLQVNVSVGETGTNCTPSVDYSLMSACATLTSFDVQLFVGSASVVSLFTPDVNPDR